jgi:hypothetical protein
MALNFALIVFSILDFLGAFLLFLAIPSSEFALAIGILLLLKGLWTIFSSVSSGFYFEFLGAIDFLAAIFLVGTYFGALSEVAWIFGLFLLLKAIYTVIRSL